MDEQQVEYIVGLDLGQTQDYTAITVLEKIRKKTGDLDRDLRPKFALPLYNVRYLERLKLGTTYPAQVAHVKNLVRQSPLRGNVTLTLDYTGVGRPVADMFQDARPQCPIYAISIHDGNAVTWDGYFVSVPKHDLVSAVQMLLQDSRLRITATLPEASMLTKELLNFKVKIDPVTAHDAYSAWRENIHDDLVLATALACWIAEKRKVAGIWGR